MANNEKNTQTMTLIDAVDALSTIAHLDLDYENAHHLNMVESEINESRVFTPYSESGDVNLVVVKTIFKTILNHLKNLYTNDSSYITDENKNERIKTIMILVGEVAKKLDTLTGLFHHAQDKSVHELKEFKQLQEFYINRVARKIDEGMLGKWILGISARQLPTTESQPSNLPQQKVIHTKHVFIDLEGVKKDSEYELFFIRKEDGTRFFNPRLVRSIKLVCDFGSYFKGGRMDDPFADVYLILDRSLHISAKNMLSSLNPVISRFYHEAATHRKNEIVLIMNKAIIALMLAANTKNLLRNQPIKSCSEYFYDYQIFLRQALQTREYQRLVAYPEQKSSVFNSCVMDTLHALCYSLYTSKPGIQDLGLFIENIIHEAAQDQSVEHSEAAIQSKQLWNRLGCDYSAMSKLIKRHPSGHLKKILEMVENGNYKNFDPLFQHNTPKELYHVYCENLQMTNIRMAAPVYQEYIQKVELADEFKGFLRALNANQKNSKFLMFNYQDRTSWREHARAKSLEELQHQPEFSKNLTVVTLAKDTEFYNQDSPYNVENHAEVFIRNLKDHLSDENAGFYFPSGMYKKSLKEFITNAIDTVHSLFFQSKNVLSREQRQDFIEIVYFFLELKVIDLVKPDLFSFSCKDGVDIAGASNATFFSFLKILNQEKLSESDMEFLNLMIYGIPVTIRERLMLQDRFNRMLSVIKVFEVAKSEMGSVIFAKMIKEAFILLYETPILSSKLIVSSTPEV